MARFLFVLFVIISSSFLAFILFARYLRDAYFPGLDLVSWIPQAFVGWAVTCVTAVILFPKKKAKAKNSGNTWDSSPADDSPPKKSSDDAPQVTFGKGNQTASGGVEAGQDPATE